MKKLDKYDLIYKTLNITPFVLALCGIGPYVLKTIDNDFLAEKRYEDLSNKVNIESTDENYVDEPVSTQVANTIAENTNDVIVPMEQVETEEKNIPTYSTSLLDEGYEFKEIDFEGLSEINSDTCGWITIDGTNIDYPIVQGEDNDYYLHHDIYGKDSSSGAIFVDSTVNSFDEELSNFTVIYGHKMHNGTMFSSLHNFKNPEFYKDHKYGIIYTKDGLAYEAEFIGGRVIDADNPIKVDTSKSEEQIFNDYIDEIKENSTFESDVDVEYGDDILVLVTCSYETKQSRYCLYAKLTKQYTNYNQMENKESINVK